MHCPYCIRDLSAERGVDSEQAYARFLAHFHHAPWQWTQ
jgi:hypothetical protein